MTYLVPIGKKIPFQWSFQESPGTKGNKYPFYLKLILFHFLCWLLNQPFIPLLCKFLRGILKNKSISVAPIYVSLRQGLISPGSFFECGATEHKHGWPVWLFCLQPVLWFVPGTFCPYFWMSFFIRLREEWVIVNGFPGITLAKQSFLISWQSRRGWQIVRTRSRQKIFLFGDVSSASSTYDTECWVFGEGETFFLSLSSPHGKPSSVLHSWMEHKTSTERQTSSRGQSIISSCSSM